MSADTVGAATPLRPMIGGRSLQSEQGVPNRAPLSDQVYDRLRDEIIRCALPPGTRLRFDGLKTRYEVSFAPIREALSRLSVEGLVIAEERRGFRVAPVSSTDFLDVTKTRHLIEFDALRESMALGGAEWEARIRVAFQRLSKEDVIDPESGMVSEGWEREHDAFHFSLISATSSKWLIHLYKVLYDQSKRYQHFGLSANPSARDPVREHADIMAAVLARDFENACSLLISHAQKSFAIIEAELNKDHGTRPAVSAGSERAKSEGDALYENSSIERMHSARPHGPR